MRFIKRYNENSEYDITFAVAKISSAFNKQAVDNLLDKEILNWSDSNDSYQSLNNKEAEDIILCRLVEWYEEKYGELTTEQEEELVSSLKQEYPRLNF